MAVCLYCVAYEAAGPHDEVAHMESAHPDIVVDRLVRAGIHYEELSPGPIREALKERVG